MNSFVILCKIISNNHIKQNFMNLLQRVETFVWLGNILTQVTDYQEENNSKITKKTAFLKEEFRTIIQKAEAQNAWFTPENIFFALSQWGKLLSEENLLHWVKNYSFSEKNPKKVALILAGNIPLVGFHDFLCVLLAGHTAVVKLSSNDKILLPFLAEILQEKNPAFAEKIIFTEEKITDYDAVIATGSNNTARYFEYYFAQKSHIIRKNRNSVAVLTGNETENQLFLLGKDIFTYFGLGCRSVSKIFVPKGYNFDTFFKAIYPYHTIINHQKYANNYDYNKAIYLMSLFKLQENGFLMLKEDSSYTSPIATLFYEFYTDEKTLKRQLNSDREQLQCIVSQGFTSEEVNFGETQNPQLFQYADNVDTLKFLTEL